MQYRFIRLTGSTESKCRSIGCLCRNGGNAESRFCVCRMEIMWKVGRPCRTKVMLMVNVM
jgi:hypothetical protein